MKLVAGTLLDKLNNGQPMKIDENIKRDIRSKQKSDGLAIVGSDVCSLFPSLKGLETARLA